MARSSDAPCAVIPRATYRMQLNRDFTLRDATDLVPYLAALGVSHLYCSPYFRARPGSPHGYDVTAHGELNPEIGSREDLERFAAVLREHGMSHILDIVPNHVGIFGSGNEWWMDVLENGPASAWAEFFDIDWQGLNPVLTAKLIVPVLGDHYGRVLERGELELRFERERGSFAVWYHEHRMPLDPREYPRILARALEHLPEGTVSAAERAVFESLITAFGHLPSREERAPERLAERNRDKEVHKLRLREISQGQPAIEAAIGHAVRELNGDAAEARSFDALDELLEAQAFRLAYWRVAASEINYRRFFDINDLAALRMENEQVFEATHGLTFELVAAGLVEGLRIDHPDGLYDPEQYFERLQRRAGARDAGELSLYVVIEKITASYEHMPASWPVHGTTGYRFANLASALLVDAGARGRLDRIYRGFVGESLAWPDVLYASRRLVLATSLAAELNVLANQLLRIAAADRRTRDFTRASLRDALAETIACFPVYRTYLRESASSEDRRFIDWAIAQAKRRSSAADTTIFDFVRAALAGEALDDAGEPRRQTVQAFARKFQQVTAPVTAKGMEDTAFYRYNRLVSLNDVGGDPGQFGASVRAFHADCRERARSTPHGMLAGSTHDSKRSEDVRARIAVLSEMPGQWRTWLARWARMNRSRKREVDGQPAPSANDEYLLYQTLVGTWPLGTPDEAALAEYRERIERYMIKAVREAKQHSSWINVNAAYEEAVSQFVQGILERRELNLFLADFEALQPRLAWFGLLNSLSQTLLRLTSPGVPDIYQGSELFVFSLVDPDNRRPVDYDRCRRLLAEVQSWRSLDAGALAARLGDLEPLLADGRAKLHLIARSLELRRAHEALFRDGEYLALAVAGRHAAHVCAFARRQGADCAITIAPRLYARLLGGHAAAPLGMEVWGDTHIELPAGLVTGARLSGVLDGAECEPEGDAGGKRTLAVGRALAAFPVAVLVG